MEKLILGFDLCDDVTKISRYRLDNMNPADISFPQADNRTVIQTALGRKKGQDGWLVGKEAYEAVLEGGGAVVDKLLTLLIKKSSVAVGDRRYQPEQLLGSYIGTLLETVYEQCGTRSVARLVFTLEKTDPAVMDSIIHCMDSLGIPRENVSIINHTEAYLYFVLRQPKANFDNRALLLDWSGTQLSSYELNLIRSVNPPVIKATRQVLETSLSQDMMSNETHRRMVDSTIREHLERIIDHRGVSSLFVSGKAMENCQEWGKSFLNALTVGKKVRKGIFYESNVFAKGAVINANNELHGRNSYPYTIICEGRVGASMWMDTSVHGSKKVLMLAKEGSNWYDCRTTADLILDEASSIRLKIKKTGEKLTVFENISLDAFPKRPNKTTRVRLILTFTSEHTAMVRVQDLGFGEFFPSSGIVVKKEIKID